MKRKMLCLLLVAILLTGTVSAASGESPYAIRVNRAANTVTVYTQDESGAYTVPYKAFLCSTARPGWFTPLGTYSMSDYRTEWCLMLDGSYGQYAVSFSGNYMFHSVCYSAPENDALLYEEYNDLGGPASMGCVRLQVADAKWIYDNCPAGTQVTVYEDAEDPGPLGKPEKVVDYITQWSNNGWDPTDPAEGNPWTFVKAENLYLNTDAMDLYAGEAQKLIAYMEPEEATNRWITWESSDPRIAAVDKFGTITAMDAGEAVITASCRDGLTASCTVTVEGALLPYDDLVPGQWYYPSARKALECGLFRGVAPRTFAPEQPMTRAMLVQTLYNRAGKPRVTGKSPFDDVRQDAWYHDAVLWASQRGLVQGMAEGFAPMDRLTRQDLAVILWRQAGSPLAACGLDAFADGSAAADYAQKALAWAVEQGLLRGSGGCLMPQGFATRSQAAAILTR